MQQDKQTLVFAGAGMDSNTAREYIQQPDCIDIVNTRTVSSNENEQGYAVDIEGTEVRLRPFILFTETIVKGKYFPEINRCIIFIHDNSNNHVHSIVEYEPETQEFTTLVRSSVLNLSLTQKVKDIKLVDKKYILWNDALNEVRMVNRERALNDEYLDEDDLTEVDINLVKAQPLHEPTAEYLTEEWSSNLLNGNLFQFRSQFIYEDGNPSAWSPISERPVPDSESAEVQNNVIRVGVDTGTKRVVEIITAARIGSGDWFIIDRLPRYELVSLPDLIPPAESVDRGYDRSTDTYYFLFRNNGLYEYVDVLETDLLADGVPRRVNALEIINKNVIALGETLEGYPRPTTNFSVFPVTQGITDPDSDDFNVISFNSLYVGGGLSNNRINFSDGTLLQGGTVSIVINQVGNPTTTTHTYIFTPADETAGVQVALTNMMNYFKSVRPVIQNIIVEPWLADNWRVRFEMQSASNFFTQMVSASSTSPAIVGDLISVPSLKKQSGYQVALAHYDKYGRPFPLVTGSSNDFTTPMTTQNMTIAMSWSLTGQTPPEGAATYRWVMSRNSRFENWVDIVGDYEPTKSTVAVACFDVTSLLNYSKNNEGSPINYDFTSGDRVNIRMSELNWRDVEIKKLELEGENLYLYTGVPDGTLLDTIYKLQVYTPRKGADDNETTVFYEVGRTYDIIGGEYTNQTGVLYRGDNYIKRRIYQNGDEAVNILVESPHSSDFYKSDYYSYGRPRTYYDTPEGHTAVARVRHSREYLRGDRLDTNMLSRFYPENYRDYERIHGSIWYLSVRTNSMIVVQEKNVGYVQVQRQIIEDAIGQQNIAVSEELLSTTVEYTRGKSTGIGNAIHSFIENYGTVYFIDPAREEIVRVGLDGIKPVGYNYSNKLRNLIRETKDQSVVESLNLYEGMYNTKYNEYMIHFKGIAEPQTYVFSEDLDKWVYRSPLMNPECGFSADNRFYSAKGNLFYEHTDEAERATIYGNYYKPALEFVVNKTPDLVKTFQTMTIQADALFATTENGIKTQLGQVSDLIPEDFDIEYLNEREGNYRANFLRDNNDPINGDRLKGRWMTVNLQAQEKRFKLFKATVVYASSPPYT